MDAVYHDGVICHLVLRNGTASPGGYPGDGDVSRWAPLLLGVVEIISLWLDDPLPAARQALLREPVQALREAAISLVDRHTDPLRTPFQDIDPTCLGLSTDDIGKPGDPWLISGGLLDALPPLAGWTLAEMKRLLKRLGNPYAIYERTEPAIRAALRQLSSADQELLSQLEFELTALAGALARPNTAVDPAFAVTAAALLPERRRIDAAIAGIEPCDDWGVKCVVSLRADDLDPHTAQETIALAKLAGGSGKPQRWQTRLTALLEAEEPTTVATAASVLRTMANTIAGITWPPAWLPFCPGRTTRNWRPARSLHTAGRWPAPLNQPNGAKPWNCAKGSPGGAPVGTRSVRSRLQWRGPRRPHSANWAAMSQSLRCTGCRNGSGNVPVRTGPSASVKWRASSADEAGGFAASTV